ncbi:MAG: relaxase/mobilization nuclease domain-containing protein [Rhodobacteraceae bacterium]|nr:relaxase/mobilization nuclease domain-containing protein [Paracoccaceae bacterium]
MILKGSQRGNAAELARHLMNAQDNEHVELHDIRGFASESLSGAMQETQAIAKGTRCKKFLFSLRLNPPQDARVPIEHFEAAIEQIEQKLGLDNQPRAIVFHEKEGRRHAHVVWSRIDAEKMKAIEIPYYKNQLMDVSKELFLEHGWNMPKGFIDRELRNPLNFTRAEWQQAKRIQQDPRMIKAMFRECWKASDNAETLKIALQEKGFYLAKGDRRGVVAVDFRGEVYALARWTGIKAKDVKARIPAPDKLPSVEKTRAHIASRMNAQLKTYVREIKGNYRDLKPSIEYRRTQLVQRHRIERKRLNDGHKARWQKETNARAARLPKGIGGIWSRITGKHSKIRQENETQTWQSHLRDGSEKDTLIMDQLAERQKLQKTILRVRGQHLQDINEIRHEIAEYLSMQRSNLPKIEAFDKASGMKKIDLQHGHSTDGPVHER